MPKLSQKSFVSGQYDRIAQNQESINGGGIVASGLSYAKNILSSDKGELRKRLGTKFLKQLDGATVLIPFRMNDENDVILTADINNIKGFKYVDGNLETLMSVRPDATISFPSADDWGDGTRKTGVVSSGDWTISFSFYDTSGSTFTGQYPGRIINGRTSSGYSAASNKKQAPQTIAISNTNTLSCMRNIKIWFWTSSSVGYQYQHWGNPVIEYSDDGVTWVGVQTDYRVGEYTPVSYTPPQDIQTQGGVIHLDADYRSKCAMTISQYNYSGKHNYWRIYFQTGSISTSVLIDGVSFVNPGLTTVFEHTSPYNEEQLKNIKYSQDKNTMFISCEGIIPYRLLNNTGELTWGSFTPTNTPTLWETMGGYPAAVSMFQNRVWFGGFQNNPTTVIASKFDDYETFNSGSPVQKDDYLNLRCNQLKTKIRNLVGGQNVICCFSEDGISYIDGGSTGLIATNENIEFKLKNRMPAGSSTPGFKDDVMLYSSSDGTKLYGVDFDLLVNRFQVSDLAKYAKDITKAKITELHYVNNESKLVYGLMEDGSMFALLYEKGQYQGFFPLDFNGTVYDIAPIKVGRNYKLLMVVFRDGNWYLEEKLDMGNYIDTSTPRLTDEEKKWATYDNLENNIALDCYQTYDEGFDCESRIDSESTMTTNTDLTEYIDKTIMLSNDNSKEFAICSVDNVELISDWTPVNTSGNLNSMGNIHGLAYINDKFVAVGQSLYAYVSTSTNGIDWAEPTEIQSMELRGADSIAYNGSVYVLIGTSRITTSTDLVNWTTPIYDADMATHRWLALSANNGTFLAVSTDGYVSTSTDGTTWTTPVENTNLGSDKVWRSVAKDNSKFVLLGNEGDISVSTDGGSTWTESIRPYFLNGKTWRSITYDGTKFIALSEDGCFSTSSNGIDWSEIVVDKNLSGNDWILLAYGNSKLVALKEHEGYYSVNQSAEISSSYYETQITIQASRGSATTYTKVYPEFTEFEPNLPQVADVAIISEGRYFNATKPDNSGKIYLPAPCHKVIYGVPYESVAIIKLQAPYESLKNIAQVDLSVIDSTHLEVGTNFDDTQNIEKIDDSSYYDLTRITMNDTYRLVLSDTPETTKNLILRSNKGVPFTVIAVDMYVNYSNLGGD